MPLALTVAEWLLLVVAIGPVVIAIVIVWIFFRAAHRADAAEAAAREQENRSGERGGQ